MDETLFHPWLYLFPIKLYISSMWSTHVLIGISASETLPKVGSLSALILMFNGTKMNYHN